MIHWDILFKLILMFSAVVGCFIYLTIMAKLGSGKSEKQKRIEYDNKRKGSEFLCKLRLLKDRADILDGNTKEKDVE